MAEKNCGVMIVPALVYLIGFSQRKVTGTRRAVTEGPNCRAHRSVLPEVTGSRALRRNPPWKAL